MRFVIMPQAIRRVLPSLVNILINTIKYSPIASTASIQELTSMGAQAVVATRLLLETWIAVSVIFMVPALTLSLFVGRLE